MNLTAWLGRMLGQENVEAIETIDPSLSAGWAQQRGACQLGLTTPTRNTIPFTARPP